MPEHSSVRGCESIAVVCQAHPYASPEPVVPTWSNDIILCLHN